MQAKPSTRTPIEPQRPANLSHRAPFHDSTSHFQSSLNSTLRSARVSQQHESSAVAALKRPNHNNKQTVGRSNGLAKENDLPLQMQSAKAIHGLPQKQFQAPLPAPRQVAYSRESVEHYHPLATQGSRQSLERISNHSNHRSNPRGVKKQPPASESSHAASLITAPGSHLNNEGSQLPPCCAATLKKAQGKREVQIEALMEAMARREKEIEKLTEIIKLKDLQIKELQLQRLIEKDQFKIIAKSNYIQMLRDGQNPLSFNDRFGESIERLQKMSILHKSDFNIGESISPSLFDRVFEKKEDGGQPFEDCDTAKSMDHKSTQSRIQSKEESSRQVFSKAYEEINHPNSSSSEKVNTSRFTKEAQEEEEKKPAAAVFNIQNQEKQAGLDQTIRFHQPLMEEQQEATGSQADFSIIDINGGAYFSPNQMKSGHQRAESKNIEATTMPLDHRERKPHYNTVTHGARQKRRATNEHHSRTTKGRNSLNEEAAHRSKASHMSRGTNQAMQSNFELSFTATGDNLKGVSADSRNMPMKSLSSKVKQIKQASTIAQMMIREQPRRPNSKTSRQAGSSIGGSLAKTWVRPGDWKNETQLPSRSIKTTPGVSPVMNPAKKQRIGKPLSSSRPHLGGSATGSSMGHTMTPAIVAPSPQIQSNRPLQKTLLSNFPNSHSTNNLMEEQPQLIERGHPVAAETPRPIANFEKVFQSSEPSYFENTLTTLSDNMVTYRQNEVLATETTWRLSQAPQPYHANQQRLAKPKKASSNTQAKQSVLTMRHSSFDKSNLLSRGVLASRAAPRSGVAALQPKKQVAMPVPLVSSRTNKIPQKNSAERTGHSTKSKKHSSKSRKQQSTKSIKATSSVEMPAEAPVPAVNEFTISGIPPVQFPTQSAPVAHLTEQNPRVLAEVMNIADQSAGNEQETLLSPVPEADPISQGGSNTLDFNLLSPFDLQGNTPDPILVSVPSERDCASKPIVNSGEAEIEFGQSLQENDKEILRQSILQKEEDDLVLVTQTSQLPQDDQPEPAITILKEEGKALTPNSDLQESPEDIFGGQHPGSVFNKATVLAQRPEFEVIYERNSTEEISHQSVSDIGLSKPSSYKQSFVKQAPPQTLGFEYQSSQAADEPTMHYRTSIQILDTNSHINTAKDDITEGQPTSCHKDLTAGSKTSRNLISSAINAFSSELMKNQPIEVASFHEEETKQEYFAEVSGCRPNFSNDAAHEAVEKPVHPWTTVRPEMVLKKPLHQKVLSQVSNSAQVVKDRREDQEDLGCPTRDFSQILQNKRLSTGGSGETDDKEELQNSLLFAPAPTDERTQFQVEASHRTGYSSTSGQQQLSLKPLAGPTEKPMDPPVHPRTLFSDTSAHQSSEAPVHPETKEPFPSEAVPTLCFPGSPAKVSGPARLVDLPGIAYSFIGEFLGERLHLIIFTNRTSFKTSLSFQVNNYKTQRESALAQADQIESALTYLQHCHEEALEKNENTVELEAEMEELGGELEEMVEIGQVFLGIEQNIVAFRDIVQ